MGFINKFKTKVSNIAEKRDEYDEYIEEERKRVEELEIVTWNTLNEKIEQIEANVEEDGESIFSKYMKEEIKTFTEEFNEKLYSAGPDKSYSKLKFGTYISDKHLSKAESRYAENLEEDEEAYFLCPINGKESFLLSDKNLHFTARDLMTKQFYADLIAINKIQKLEIVEAEDGYMMLVNNVELLFIEKSYDEKENIDLLDYIDRVSSGDFIITEEQISNRIKITIGKKVVKIIKGYLEEDEHILYIASGMDSITSSDYILCTSKQLLIIDRESFGLGQHSKQFYYKDIVSISTKATIVNAVLKQSDIIVYVSGTSFPIELVDTHRAERIIKIVNENKKDLNNGEDSKYHSTISNGGPKEDIIEQIKKKSDLKDAGILTEDEFQTKKAVLLERL